MRLALTGGALGAGMAAIMVGAAAIQVAVQPEDTDQVSPQLATILEQVPRGGWAWAGQGAAVAYGAAGVAAAGGLVPVALTPALLAVLVAGPCLAWAAAERSLRHFIQHGQGHPPRSRAHRGK